MHASRSLVATVAVIACTSVVPAGAKQLVRQIPFGDWLAAQGINIIAWQEQTGPQVHPPVLGNVGVLDYAGGRAQAFGLSFGFAASGSVSVRELFDGSGEVTVNADFSNAITWARDANAVPLLGYTPAQLAADPSLSPGLSSGHLQAKYTVPDADVPQLNLFVVAFQGGVRSRACFSTLMARGRCAPGLALPRGLPASAPSPRPHSSTRRAAARLRTPSRSSTWT